MTNFHVGQQCLIIGSTYKETESNIGKVVTLHEFVAKHEGYVITNTMSLLRPSSEDSWMVEGLGLVALFEDDTIQSVNYACIRQQHLMPLDGFEETEKNKQEELVEG